jgi:hypothetical protein
LFLLIFSLLIPPSSNAQTQQPFLFAADGSNGKLAGFAVLVRNDQTGDLTEVPGSPFTAFHTPNCWMSIIDPKGRFTYGAGGLGAAMYSINATTGAVTEVTGSPFAASTATGSLKIAAEATGQGD